VFGKDMNHIKDCWCAGAYVELGSESEKYAKSGREGEVEVFEGHR